MTNLKTVIVYDSEMMEIFNRIIDHKLLVSSIERDEKDDCKLSKEAYTEEERKTLIEIRNTLRHQNIGKLVIHEDMLAYAIIKDCNFSTDGYSGKNFGEMQYDVVLEKPTVGGNYISKWLITKVNSVVRINTEVQIVSVGEDIPLLVSQILNN